MVLFKQMKPLELMLCKEARLIVTSNSNLISQLNKYSIWETWISSISMLSPLLLKTQVKGTLDLLKKVQPLTFFKTTPNYSQDRPQITFFWKLLNLIDRKALIKWIKSDLRKYLWFPAAINIRQLKRTEEWVHVKIKSRQKLTY